MEFLLEMRRRHGVKRAARSRLVVYCTHLTISLASHLPGVGSFRASDIYVITRPKRIDCPVCFSVVFVLPPRKKAYGLGCNWGRWREYLLGRRKRVRSRAWHLAFADRSEFCLKYLHLHWSTCDCIPQALGGTVTRRYGMMSIYNVRTVGLRWASGTDVCLLR